MAGANASIALLVECKAPEIPITQATFDQIARYQLALNATYLMVTNGLHHIYCQIDYDKTGLSLYAQLPAKRTSLMTTAIAILNYNGAALLREFFAFGIGTQRKRQGLCD